MESIELFEKLLHAELEDEVGEILAKAGFDLQCESAWRPLGDMENNFSTVGNQQTEATAALVEKIINGIDAELMLECFRAGIDPEGPEAPKTMAVAVERFFGVRDGLLANLDAKRQTELAKRLHVVAAGSKTAPSYLVIDGGEGQTPDAFPDTFLSLNKSNKIRIPFVQGKFNSRGHECSAVLRREEHATHSIATATLYASSRFRPLKGRVGLHGCPAHEANRRPQEFDVCLSRTGRQGATLQR